MLDIMSAILPKKFLTFLGVDKRKTPSYNKRVKIHSVVDDFKKNKPGTKDEIEDLGYDLKFLSDGLFREVYALKHEREVLPFVIKLPKSGNFTSCLEHVKCEMATIKKIKKDNKFAALRRYLPKTYYYNEKSGLVLQKRYISFNTNESTLVATILSNLVSDLNGHGGDVHESNVMYILDKTIGEKKPVIIDFGYF